MSEHLAAETLLSVRKELEELTSNYILEILKSKESADSHAKKLMTILNSIGEGILVFDVELKLVLANQAACNLVGFTITEMTRNQIRESFKIYRKGSAHPLPPEEEPLVIALNERRTVTDELLLKGEVLSPEGLWVRITAAPVIDAENNIIGGVSVFQNINERVILQRQHDALVSLITHDFKNHFLAEHTVVEHLMRDFAEKLSEQEREILNELKRSSRHYADLGGTLLETFRSAVGDPAITKADINLNDVLENAMQLNALLSTRQNVKLTCEIEDGIPVMQGVVTAWRQVFHNLIQNAINASPEGSSISIKAANTTYGIFVSISDNGSGMSEEQVSKIFDPNRRELPIKSAHSTGFGLYLCRYLIESQGGTIHCHSKLGEGTTFTVGMPVAH